MEDFDFDFSLLQPNSNWQTQLNKNIHYIKPSRKCDLCAKPRRTFYCKNCVKNGDFMHSTSHFAERFAEKRLAVFRKQNKRQDLVKECDEYIDALKSKENQLEGKRMRTERINMLKTLISEKRKKIDKKKKMLNELNQFNQGAREDIRRNEDCQQELKNATKKLLSRKPILVNELEKMKPCLKTLIRKRTEELVRFIFPINEIQSTKSSSCTTDSQEDIKNKLAEATRTAYIRGRWVFTDSWGETQHSIVAPTLPDSGDYSPYVHWVSANKDNAMIMTCSADVDHNPAFNISAALTFTTQFVDILAHFLNVKLPNKLLYSEFCTKNLNEKKFVKYVTFLNANILMLCLSQNVDPTLLHPSQTIRNLLMLLDTSYSDLGRVDSSDIDMSCISYFEEQLAHQIRSATTRQSISVAEDEDRDNAWLENADNDDDDDGNSDHIAPDWETVPLVSCPEAMPGSNHTIRKPSINTQQTNSIAGGLVTSAAASIASIWRGWSNNK